MEKISRSLLSGNDSRFIYFCCLLALLTLGMFFFYTPWHIGADTMFHYNRINILMDALRDGSYPNYMDYNSLGGYGYIVNIFYPDFLLIPFAVLGNFTSLNTAFISLLATCTILTGIFTYISVNGVYKNSFMACISALLFTFAAYRIFDVFYRGAIGEYMAFTFIPLAFWGAYESIKGDYKKWYILTVAFSLLIYTHVISSAIAFVALIIFLIINIKRIIETPERLLYLSIAGVATIFATSAYIIPLLEQIASNSFYFTSNPATDISYSLLKMNDIIAGLFNNIESAYKSAPDAKTGGILVALLFLRLSVRDKPKQLKHIDIWVVIGFILIISESYIFPWQIFPFSKFTFIQHPCRLLLIVSFIFSLAGAFYMNETLQNKNKKIAAAICLTLVLLLVMKSDGASNRKIFAKHPKLDNQLIYSLTIGGAEYLPAAFPSPYHAFVEQRGTVVVARDSSTVISNMKRVKGNLSFDIELAENDFVELPLTYYIGYQAILNGKKIEYQSSEDGLVALPIGESGKVKIEYKGTTIQSISYCISILFIFIFIFYFMYNYKKKDRSAPTKSL